MSEEPTIKRYTTEVIKLKDIEFDTSNPNKMSALQEQSLNYSLEKWGYLDRIVIDQNNVVANGEHRARSLIKQGVEEAEVIRYNFKNDRERRLFRQSFNKLRGEHEPELDRQDILAIISNSDNDRLEYMRLTAEQDEQRLFDILNPKQSTVSNKTNFEKKEVVGSVDIEQAELEDLPDPEEIKEPVTQTGDIWKLGKHYLLCGDFSDNEAVAKLTGNKKMDMVFVDPPYNIMGSSSGFTKMDDDTVIQPFFRNLLLSIKENTKPDAHIYICCNWRSYYPIMFANKNINLTPKNLIVWYKPNTRLGSMYSSSHELILFMSNQPLQKHLSVQEGRARTVYGETNVWVYVVDTNSVREHFAQKPIVLPERAIKNSTDENELVMDMCVGSGTTLMACEQTDRICYAVEINPRYCDIVIQRWEKHTNQKAEKITSVTETAIA